MTALILGCGYTGGFLKRALEAQGEAVVWTRREPSEGGLLFNLEDHATWVDLPDSEICYWMFPAAPKNLVEKFIDEEGRHFKKIICVGSTSSYLHPEETITETSEPNPADPRVQGEGVIQAHGGIVVRASGIYGPNRSPLSWISAGRVGRSEQWVNFIHVEDLVGILLATAKNGKPGATYLASDGNPHQWTEIIDRVEKAGWAKASSHPSLMGRVSKRVDSSRTQANLGFHFKYPDLFSGLRDLVNERH